MYLVNLQKYSLKATIAVFFILSHFIFDAIYKASQEVVDEEFHLAQAEEFCNLNFFNWNPKITTFPGLYFLSTALCSPLKACTTYCFRHVSFIAATINLVLFYKIFHLRRRSQKWMNLLSAVNLSLLPPLFFFNHLYYTDVASVMTVLLTMYFNMSNKHAWAALFGACSILTRQTNVIWVIMFGGQYTLNYAMQFSIPGRNRDKHTTNIRDIHHLRLSECFLSISRLPMYFWYNFSMYATVVLGFIIFVIVNGGIVVGDKSAHEAELHLPQLFYFSLFTLVFGYPHLIDQVGSFYSWIKNHSVFAILALFYISLVTHYNTLIHPYLLADNRHYTFYLWNRYFKSHKFRLLMAPVYEFGLYVAQNSLYDETNVWPYFMYVPCLILSLCFQKLIEIRYFIIPFIIWRLQIRNMKPAALIFEFVLYVLINSITIGLFLKKEIVWDDRSSVQRIMW